jgi:alkanesulfonate monooxygenase
VAETEGLACAKAQKTLDTPKTNIAGDLGRKGQTGPEPQNIGLQRLLALAEKGEVHDRALWYPTVTATNARGASTALVGSWHTVADSTLDYVNLGCELISIRVITTWQI